MKLYIHEKCFEKILDLPKTVQKNVLDFQKKFRLNSKAESIHLEPIKTFKDKQLRTARVNDKYRAIVRVPESGDNYYLLWVDNHDEAMDWAKNKVFQWNDQTQMAQIFDSPDTIEVAGAKELAKSVKLFESFTNGQLGEIGVPDVLLPIVRAIENLDHLSRLEQKLPADVFENLFFLSEGLSIDQLIAEIQEGKNQNGDSSTIEDSTNNKRSFIEVSDQLISELINGDLSKWQVFLHPSQRKLVEGHFKGSVKVTGGAGTGKTVVALHRVKHLSSMVSSGKILFTTFTNALTVNLRLLAEKLGIDQNKVMLTNIDTLVSDLSSAYKLKLKGQQVLDMPNSKTSEELWEQVLELNLSEFDAKFLYTEHQQVILYNNITNLEEYLKTSRIGRGKPITRKQRMEIWRLIEIYNSEKRRLNYYDRSELINAITNFLNSAQTKPFEYVIADELQDMSNVELRFLRSLADSRENDLFMVGDPYQKIYAKKINFSSAGIQIRGNKSKQLRINYRTSEEIKRLALASIQDLSYDDFDGESESLKGYLSIFHGEKPTYEVFKTKSEEIEAINSHISEFLHQGFGYSDIAIALRTKESIKEIKTSLHKLKIPYCDLTTGLKSDKDGITLSTFHGMKGLEFKAVILADVNNRTCPLIFSGLDQWETERKQDYFNSEKSLIYVAITRAINILKITGTGVKSEVVKV
jgi:hypothetical protein